MTIKNHTTGLRPWKCNSSVSYNNFCVICALTIIVNRYTSHLPFQGKVKGHQLSSAMLKLDRGGIRI